MTVSALGHVMLFWSLRQVIVRCLFFHGDFECWLIVRNSLRHWKDLVRVCGISHGEREERRSGGRNIKTWEKQSEIITTVCHSVVTPCYIQNSQSMKDLAQNKKRQKAQSWQLKRQISYKFSCNPKKIQIKCESSLYKELNALFLACNWIFCVTFPVILFAT